MYGIHAVTCADIVPNVIGLAIRRCLDKISYTLEWKRVAVTKQVAALKLATTSTTAGKKKRATASSTGVRKTLSKA